MEERITYYDGGFIEDKILTLNELGGVKHFISGGYVRMGYSRVTGCDLVSLGFELDILIRINALN